jgi:hypothetical protein
MNLQFTPRIQDDFVAIRGEKIQNELLRMVNFFIKNEKSRAPPNRENVKNSNETKSFVDIEDRDWC